MEQEICRDQSYIIDTRREKFARLISASRLLGVLVSIGMILSFGLTFIPSASTGLFGRILQALSNLWLFAGGAFLTSQFTKHPVQSFMRALSPYTMKVYMDSETAKYQDYLRRFQNSLPYLSVANCENLNKRFLFYESCLYDGSESFTEFRDSMLRANAKYFDYIFKIIEPPVSRKLSLTTQQIDKKCAQLLDLFATYPDQKAVLLPIAKTLGYAQYQKGGKNDNIRALYLKGPPGVGKTTLMQKLFEIFDVKLITLKGKNTIDSNNHDWPGWSDFEIKNISPLVRAIHASRAEGYTGYTALFFDELDKLPRAGSGRDTPALTDVAQHLLKLTDSDQETIKDEYTGIHVSTKEFIVVIAANNCILDQIPGLDSRVDKIEFHAITTDLKQEIARRKLEIFAGEHNLIITEKMKSTVCAIARNNKHAGVREMIATIRTFVIEIAQNDFYVNTRLAEPKAAVLTRYNTFEDSNAKSSKISDEELEAEIAESCLRMWI